MAFRRCRQAACALALWATVSGAGAASFSVSPTRLTLTAAEPIVALTVRNGNDEPAVIHLEVMAWMQENGVDSYEPSRELVATPPIFTLPPRGTQTIRIGLRRPGALHTELTYRVYLLEVPAPPAANFVGMRMALRLGVPVFVPPSPVGGQTLAWHLRRSAGGVLSAVGVNEGTVHARILELSFFLPSGGLAGEATTLATDLHAGQQRAWPVPGGELPIGTRLRLTAKTERGDVHADLVVP